MAQKRLKLVVLLSGSGSTLQNLINVIDRKELDAEIVHVVSSKPNVLGLERAAKAGIPTSIVERKKLADRNAFSEAIFHVCRENKADLVCMAGFLELLPIPEGFTNKVMNIHPSLIPAFCGKGFYGLKVHEAALQMGVKVSGCTVHFADNEFDHGPILVQKVVEVKPDDTPQSLAARVFEAECVAYPEAIRGFGMSSK